MPDFPDIKQIARNVAEMGKNAVQDKLAEGPRKQELKVKRLATAKELGGKVHLEDRESEKKHRYGGESIDTQLVYGLHDAKIDVVTELENGVSAGNLTKEVEPAGDDAYDPFVATYRPRRRETEVVKPGEPQQYAKAYLNYRGEVKKTVTTRNEGRHFDQEETSGSVRRKLKAYEESKSKYHVSLVEEGALSDGHIRREMKLEPFFEGSGKKPAKYLVTTAAYKPVVSDDDKKMRFVCDEFSMAFVNNSKLLDLAVNGLDSGDDSVDTTTLQTVNQEISKAKHMGTYVWNKDDKEYVYKSGTGKRNFRDMDTIDFGDSHVDRAIGNTSPSSSDEHYSMKVVGKPDWLNQETLLYNGKIAPGVHDIQYLYASDLAPMKMK